MKRASPVELRHAIESATVLVRAGVLFVAMPVLSREDAETLITQSLDRLDKLASQAEADEETP